jgi:hypothetical protein
VWPCCPWLPSHREPDVLWLSSCHGCGVALLPLPVLFFLVFFELASIFLEESLAARQVGSLREATFGELPFVKFWGKFGFLGLLCNGGGVARVSTGCFVLLGPFSFLYLFLRSCSCYCRFSLCPCCRGRRCGLQGLLFDLFRFGSCRCLLCFGGRF